MDQQSFNDQQKEKQEGESQSINNFFSFFIQEIYYHNSTKKSIG